MNFIYSNWYGGLLKISDIILVSVLWAVVSIPLVTIYPATIALIETIRRWEYQGETGAVFINFFDSFRKNIKIKIVYSIIILVSLASSYINMYLVSSNLIQMNEMIILLSVIFNGITLLVFFFSCILWDETIQKLGILKRLKNAVEIISLFPIKSIFILLFIILITETVSIFPIVYFIVGIVLGLLSIATRDIEKIKV